jgi:hypothetical protein
MASKLDQSLDAIIGDRPTARRGRGGRRPRTRAAPVGGVKKAVATAKGAAAKAAAKVTGRNTKADTAAPAGGATKIIVSNLVSQVRSGKMHLTYSSPPMSLSPRSRYVSYRLARHRFLRLNFLASIMHSRMAPEEQSGTDPSHTVNSGCADPSSFADSSSLVTKRDAGE